MAAAFEPDNTLREDVRLLGRLLGDTVRDQEGAAAFDLVERVRQSSIAFRRDEDAAARQELERTLDGLDREQTMVVVRAFSYFSHLANLAEDLHNIRRARQSEIDGATPADGTLARALDKAAAAGTAREALTAFFQDGLVVPVLTAHPTEVQRKSVRDLETRIEQLLEARDRRQLTPRELGDNDEEVRRAVLSLWQTRMLRLEKLDVLDEVANGLSFFEQTFLPEVPLLYGGLEDELQRRYPDGAPVRPAAVPAHRLVDRRRPRRQPVRDGGHPATGAADAVVAGPRFLPRPGTRARHRAQHDDARERCLAGIARARRALAGQEPASS